MGKLDLMRRRTSGAIRIRARQPAARRVAWFSAVAALALLVAACGRPGPENGQSDADAETAGPSMDAGEVSANNAEGGAGTGAGTGVTIPGRAGVRVVSDGPILTPLPPTTTPTTAAPQAQTYEVQPGDTLSVIAERFGITTTALAEANGIDDVNTIKPGQELIVPPPSS